MIQQYTNNKLIFFCEPTVPTVGCFEDLCHFSDIFRNLEAGDNQSLKS